MSDTPTATIVLQFAIKSTGWNRLANGTILYFSDWGITTVGDPTKFLPTGDAKMIDTAPTSTVRLYSTDPDRYKNVIVMTADLVVAQQNAPSAEALQKIIDSATTQLNALNTAQAAKLAST